MIESVKFKQHMNEMTHPDDVDLSSFKLKKTLNPQFWDEGGLNPKVRRELLKIAKDFIVDLELNDLEIEDILMVGSLCNYNWNEDYSDIDLHILIDFDEIPAERNIVKKFFDSEKKIWNDTHVDINILGYPVEMYVQDTKENLSATGIYSLLYDEWIKEPSLDKIENKNLDKSEIQQGAADFMNEIDDLELKRACCKYPEEFENVYIEASDLIDRIKRTRKSSMEKYKDHAEMSEGNLIFKTLRRNGYMKKLIDIKRESYDLLHSFDAE